MNTIRQYRPASIDNDQKSIVEFTTSEELFAIPFVAHFTTIENFYRFSFFPGGPALMAEYDGGRRWYVVGYIGGLFNLEDIPIWEEA
jgi:hypothetical protein